ncbi:MAG: hypothetical protein ACI9XC_001006 [Gammaproteobacteria bacterium]|jgi:hypothetical protein
MNLPELRLEDWISTRDTLHGYAKVVGKIRSHFMPKQKHWWHITLHASATGLTTTPMPIKSGTIELHLDFLDHDIQISTNRNERIRIPLDGQSPTSLMDDLTTLLTDLGIDITIDGTGLLDIPNTDYDYNAVTNYWIALSQIDSVFKCFKGTLREETGPVHVFPHHFDLSMNWFSGNLIPEVDPNDEENADEQMNFGFVSGDEGIKDAYFYITAYPNPDGWGDFQLPDYASWQRQGWVGAILLYKDLREQKDTSLALHDFLAITHASGKNLMKKD